MIKSGIVMAYKGCPGQMDYKQSSERAVCSGTIVTVKRSSAAPQVQSVNRGTRREEAPWYRTLRKGTETESYTITNAELVGQLKSPCETMGEVLACLSSSLPSMSLCTYPAAMATRLSEAEWGLK